MGTKVLFLELVFDVRYRYIIKEQSKAGVPIITVEEALVATSYKSAVAPVHSHRTEFIASLYRNLSNIYSS